MQDGFVKVAARTPEVRVADVAYNMDSCLRQIDAAIEEGTRVIVLPELCVTAYTCEDLFWQDALLDAAEKAVAVIAQRTSHIDALVLLGAPVRTNAKLYNCAIALAHGNVLGIVPKRAIPTYNEFYESRHFSVGPEECVPVDFAGYSGVPFGTRQLFACDELPQLVVAAEICEDLWIPNPPSTQHALAGATLICNLSASNAIVGKADYRRSLVSGQSARLICGYVYASAGNGESTQDLVFGGHDMIAENGRMLAEAEPFGTGAVTSEVDVAFLCEERRRMSTFVTAPAPEAMGYTVTHFSLTPSATTLTRFVDPHPFVPSDAERRAERCEDVLSIQARGLAKRLAHTHSSHVVIGVSGGLDSTLALLVCARAFELLDLDRIGIIAVTMPGFGTTGRTHGNATTLADALGCDLREVNISDAVRQHFSDIGHDESVHDVTYENSQARERTQVLMDIANQEGGLVVGTGDLSELALGWATYNGDHMSMYAVNCSIPKTLIRFLIETTAERETPELAAVLRDVIDTPVSPELLPADGDGAINQKTEELIGPYELHDFFLYHFIKYGAEPEKIRCLAETAFAGTYPPDVIGRWFALFVRRFFRQQFKRSCVPDGPKVGTIALSPRGDWRMPSDACAAVWQAELEKLH